MNLLILIPENIRSVRNKISVKLITKNEGKNI